MHFKGAAGGDDDDEDDDDDDSKRGNTGDVNLPQQPNDQHDEQEHDMEQGGVEQYEVVVSKTFLLCDIECAC